MKQPCDSQVEFIHKTEADHVQTQKTVVSLLRTWIIWKPFAPPVMIFQHERRAVDLSETVKHQGYAFLSRFRPDVSGVEALMSIGIPINIHSDNPIHRLTPKKKNETTPNTYSGIYGLGEFPFHTDFAHWRTPPRYFLLRCVVGYENVPTILIDGLELIDEINLSIFGRALMQPRRPVSGSLHILRLYHRLQGEYGLIRWDEEFIRPGSEAGKLGSDLLRAKIADATHIPIALVNAGDTIIIDNWRILHSRSPILTGCEGRIIERAYLESLH